ncbi:MAG: restriction endonuclease, partial [Clostridia bacterium]|nr:restriction endonuclease [Clostridia bacterium]
MNLLENISTDMSPQEFEKQCLQLLESIEDKSDKCTIEHNQIYRSDDGTYQLDGVITFESFDVIYKTIVECKRYKNPIKRSQIQILHDTIRSTGAHKGIFISTSSFQKGAMEYAKKHGIALMQVVDGWISTIQNSVGTQLEIRTIPPKFMFTLYNLKHFIPSGFFTSKMVFSIIEYLQ